MSRPVRSPAPDIAHTFLHGKPSVSPLLGRRDGAVYHEALLGTRGGPSSRPAGGRALAARTGAVWGTRGDTTENLCSRGFVCPSDGLH